jgi:SAM-dependent methyltransferase
MGLDWIDVRGLSFNTLLLLERVQLSWLPGWLDETALGVALRENPVVGWFMAHKCPEIADWVAGVMENGSAEGDATAVRAAEETIMNQINDLLVYVVDPGRYDAQPFLGWDSQELLELADFRGKTVLDIGSGTGRLALTVAPQAKTVYAIEPVGNLRHFLRKKAAARGLRNVYTMDGLITRIPFPDGFSEITMGAHVFGDAPEAELAELRRVTQPGGKILLVPGTSLQQEETHQFLVREGFDWAVFRQPGDGLKRKYWAER